MKKDEFVKLALMGLASGMLTANAIDALQDSDSGSETHGKGCNALASGCKSCGNVAENSGGSKGSCNAIASGCKSGCNAIADKCGSKCNHIAGQCGGKNGCGGVIAENDTPKSLTAPGPIPKETEKSEDKGKTDYDPNDQNIGYHLMTDDELMLELNDETLKIYEKMTPEAKALARLVASARCNATNECKGLNACKTEKNNCAGQGSCKGTGKCAFSDKNLAVKVVEKQMEAKRQSLTH